MSLPSHPGDNGDAVQKERWARHSYDVRNTPRTLRSVVRSVSRNGFLSLGAVLPVRRPGLRCVYCHHVFDDQVANFRRICRALMTMGTFIDSDTCLRMLNGEVPITNSYFHLSFDDGLRNILTNAVPVLQELSLPATLFVPTGIVGTNFETVSRYCRDSLRCPAPIEVLSWSDLTELHRLGFTIASHTRSHARLLSLQNQEELYTEITVPRLEIQERLGVPCRYIAWPYGTVSDCDARSLDFVRESGYSGCFGGHRGSVRPGITSPFAIPRHHFETDWPVRHIRFFAAGYWQDDRSVYTWLKPDHTTGVARPAAG